MSRYYNSVESELLEVERFLRPRNHVMLQFFSVKIHLYDYGMQGTALRFTEIPQKRPKLHDTFNSDECI